MGGGGENQFMLTGMYINQGKLWVQVYIPKLKPVLNSRMGKAKPGTENPGEWKQVMG